MKNVILSADGDSKVYSVPDVVADNLEEYCLEFCNQWLPASRSAKRLGDIICYDESTFIEYLNQWRFPSEQSTFIENIGWIGSEEQVPQKYRGCPYFNF